MTWKTWLYVATPPAGGRGGAASRDKTIALADKSHLVVHTFFVNNNPLTPYAHAGLVDAGHRLVLAFSDNHGPSTIGTYLVVAAEDVGLSPLRSAAGLLTTQHTPLDCWARFPEDLISNTGYIGDPFLHVACGIAVQRIHGARVTHQQLVRAFDARNNVQHALNPWPIEDSAIRMPGEP